MKYALIFGLLSCSVPAFSQYEQNYLPIQYTGSVPGDFFSDPAGTTKANVKAETVLDSKRAGIFYTEVNYETQQILHSGRVYFNDPFTTYLREIAAKLLNVKPEVAAQIKIYATRSATINAITLPDGHIFVNIGLINAMDNEDQLAFILGHEIAHFANKHALTTYKRKSDIKDQEKDAANEEGTQFRNLSYSRENEYDADAAGMQLVVSSVYNAYEAGKALENLTKTDSLAAPIVLANYFNNETFTIDTNWISAKAVKSWVRSAEDKSESYYGVDKTEDIYSTHPDVEKRALALNEILKATEYAPPAADKKEASKFESIKTQAAFEMVNNSHSNGQYAFSVYQSLKLLDKYPDNLFLNVNICRSLYWLCHMREIDALDKTLSLDGLAKGNNYEKLNTFLSKPGISEYKKLSYGFLKARLEKFRGQDDFIFYHGLITEQYLGKEAATVFYRQYATQFPSGNNIIFVNRKLNSNL